MIYVPITFVVKAVIAVVCYFVYHKLLGKLNQVILKGIITGCFSTVIVAGGYCFFEYFMYGSGAFAQRSGQSHPGTFRPDHFDHSSASAQTGAGLQISYLTE